MEVPETEAKTADEGGSVEETEETNDDQFDEVVESTNECLFDVLVCDQLLDDSLTPVQSEIQPIFIDTLPDPVMVPRIFALVHI